MNKKQLELIFEHLISEEECVLYNFIDTADISIEAKNNMRRHNKKYLQQYLEDLKKSNDYDVKSRVADKLEELKDLLEAMKTRRINKEVSND
jgi:hypothetical protein